MRVSLRAVGHALVLWAVVGCTKSRPPEKPTPVSRDDVRLAVLLAESDVFPKLAGEVNKQLGEARVDGVSDYFHANVSLEVVQLAIECVDDSDACYVAAGRSLSADQLLFARIERTRPKHHAVTVTITLYDVRAGAAIASASKVFRSERRARKGAEELVRAVTASATTVSVTPAGGR